MKDKVLDAIDLVDLIGERVSLTRKGKDYVGLCPFHDDHKPSFSVSPTKQIFKCWSCGVGGDAIQYVKLSERVDFREALEILAKRVGIELNGPALDPVAAAGREKLRHALIWAHEHFQRNLRQTPGAAAMEYARSRGFDDAAIQRFGFGLALNEWDDLSRAAQRAGLDFDTLTDAGLVARNERGRLYDRFRNRLMFPIRDGQGRLVAFGGRTLGDDPAKYMNSPESPLFSKSRVLFGLDLARSAIQAQREAIVVEGYIDALLLHSRGIQNAVAPLGTALTEPQVKLLRPLADRVVMCFDADEAGGKAAERAIEVALTQRIDVKIMSLPAGEDPADCLIRRGAAGFKSLLPMAVSALEYKWRQMSLRFEAQDARGRREAIDAYLRFIGTIVTARGIDPVEQGLLVGRLADLLTLPASQIYEWMNRTRAPLRKESTAGTDGARSAYDEAIRHVPPGLAPVATELFAAVLASPERFGQLDGSIGAVSSYCGLWRRLHEVLQRHHSEKGGFTKADVLTDCEEPPLMELCTRAARSSPASQEECEALARRAAAEIDRLRMDALRENQGRARSATRTSEERERDFRSLLEVARRRHDTFAIEPLRGPA